MSNVTIKPGSDKNIPTNVHVVDGGFYFAGKIKAGNNAHFGQTFSSNGSSE
jgi:hypothetical protein